MNQNNYVLEDLQELKIQFGLLNEKLEKQAIVNDNLMKESMKTKLSPIEKWYQMRFWTYYVGVPVLSLMFFVQHLHWGFIGLFWILATIEFYMNKKAYWLLNIQNLPQLSMIEASECVTKHKKWRDICNRVLFIPMMVLLVWTMLIATNYTLNYTKISIIIAFVSVVFIYGWQQAKANRKRLDEVLEYLRKIKG